MNCFKERSQDRVIKLFNQKRIQTQLRFCCCPASYRVLKKKKRKHENMFHKIMHRVLIAFAVGFLAFKKRYRHRRWNNFTNPLLKKCQNWKRCLHLLTLWTVYGVSTRSQNWNSWPRKDSQRKRFLSRLRLPVCCILETLPIYRRSKSRALNMQECSFKLGLGYPNLIWWPRLLPFTACRVVQKRVSCSTRLDTVQKITKEKLVQTAIRYAQIFSDKFKRAWRKAA